MVEKIKENNVIYLCILYHMCACNALLFNAFQTHYWCKKQHQIVF